MATKFICLANSYKEGGRCLAGIEIENNNPVITDNKPKWIRPVCNTEHGEIPSNIVSHIRISDIVEIQTSDKPTGEYYQSENVFFDINSIKVIGKYDESRLDELCDNRSLIFGNKGKAISGEFINKLDYSLMLVKTNQFSFINRTYENTPERNQIRMSFQYNSNNYDFPVTDPVFMKRYEMNPDFVQKYNNAYIVLSVGVCWNDWYYKLVTTIIFLNF